MPQRPYYYGSCSSVSADARVDELKSDGKSENRKRLTSSRNGKYEEKMWGK